MGDAIGLLRSVGHGKSQAAQDKKSENYSQDIPLPMLEKQDKDTVSCLQSPRLRYRKLQKKSDFKE
tara:strand:+ start:74195 stop:74392 length:198 start_codon:yes stop_codon:yes gene_type:complete